MPELGVNIDHVATIRQARRTYEPDPVWAAAEAELGGADGITVHLREDRRHIQDRDVEVLRKTVSVKLNLEMACSAEIVEIARRIKPDQATLVPERREEVTTEGGLDVVGQRGAVEAAIKQLRDAGIYVSLFLDPDPRQLDLAKSLGAEAVELHTGKYALANWKNRAAELKVLTDAGKRIRDAGLALARRPRPELPKRAARGGNPGDARTQHRPRHRLACRFHRSAGSRPRNEVAGAVSGPIGGFQRASQVSMMLYAAEPTSWFMPSSPRPLAGG